MSASRRILKRRASIRSIRTVTRTMEMVSTVRLQRVRRQADALVPYARRVWALLGDLARRPGGMKHPLMQSPEGLGAVLIVLTSDRGLAGAYNEAVLTLASGRLADLASEGVEVEVHVVGRKGATALARMGCPPAEQYTDLPYPPDFASVARLAQRLMERFLDGRIGRVEVACTHPSPGEGSRPVLVQVLPVETPIEGEKDPHAPPQAPAEAFPSLAEVLGELVPTAVRLGVHQCFLDAAVAEQTARMTAMREATHSADDMIRKLSLRYNRSRQTQITSELAEIMGGRGERG